MVVSIVFNLIHNQMKKISKLKLTQLNKAELEGKQMNAVKGGALCPCICIMCLCMGGTAVMDDNAVPYEEWMAQLDGIENKG